MTVTVTVTVTVGNLPVVLARLFRLLKFEGPGIRGQHPLAVDLHGAEEVLVNDRGVALLGPAQGQVERVEEPK